VIIILNIILSSILFWLIPYALQERENSRKIKHEMCKETEDFNRQLKRANKEEMHWRSCHAHAELNIHEHKNKIELLEKQIAKLKRQLNNSRQNVKRRKKQLQELKWS
jgi:septal ring factor EnvC (AmiA/AmiB activator)